MSAADTEKAREKAREALGEVGDGELVNSGIAPSKNMTKAER